MNEMSIANRSTVTACGKRSSPRTLAILNARQYGLTELEHVVPALAEGVPGSGEDAVEPARHGHGEQGHDEHGVYGLDEALRLRRDLRVQAADPGLEQHRGNPCAKLTG